MKKNISYLFKSFILVPFVFSLTLQSAHIIFDLGKVLVDVRSIAVFKELGLKNSLFYVLSRGSVKGLRTSLNNKLYEILNKEEIIKKLNITLCNAHKIKDANGTQLPSLMYNWFEGNITCNQIKKVVLETISKHSEWFSRRAEQRMIQSLVQFIFTPEKLGNGMKFNKNAVKCVRQCKLKGHQVYVLSNWDRESFSVLKRKHAKIFNLFDGIVISGECHCAKPGKEIYLHLLKQCNLKPEECIFIDDQIENLNTARKYGISTIHCKRNKKFFKSKKLLAKIHQFSRVIK